MPVNIVADSGFGGVELLKELNQALVHASFSLPSNDSLFIWELMKRGVLDRGQWNACCSSSGMLSIYQGDEVNESGCGTTRDHFIYWVQITLLVNSPMIIPKQPTFECGLQ